MTKSSKKSSNKPKPNMDAMRALLLFRQNRAKGRIPKRRPSPTTQQKT